MQMSRDLVVSFQSNKKIDCSSEGREVVFGPPQRLGDEVTAHALDERRHGRVSACTVLVNERRLRE